jgi:hypothetical protein
LKAAGHASGPGVRIPPAPQRNCTSQRCGTCRLQTDDHVSSRPRCPGWVPAADLAIAVAILAANRGKIIIGTTFDNVTIDTTGTYGIVIDNIGGSAAFCNTKVSGTPSGGLFNPTTTFTIVRGPGNSGF